MSNLAVPTDGFSDPAEILSEIAEIFSPVERVEISKEAEKCLRVMSGSSFQYVDTRATPYMREPMNLLNSRHYDAVIFVGPARTGKTNCLLDCWWATMVVNFPGDMLIVHMTRDTGRSYARLRLDREIQNTPELKSQLSTRKNDDNILEKFFKAGNSLVVGWPTGSQLAGRDFPYVAFTDFDRMDEDAGGEGDTFAQGQKRTQTYMSRAMTMAESSPGREIIDPTWKPKTPHEAPPTKGGIFTLYNRGDRRRLYWQCVHESCRQWFQPIMDNFDYSKDKNLSNEDRSETARVFCKHCGGIIDPTQKRERNLKHRWLRDGESLSPDGELLGKALKPKSRIASYWMEGPAAAFQSWTDLALKEILALDDYDRTGLEDSLKGTYGLDQGRAYLPKAMESDRSAEDLQARSEELGARVVHRGVRYLTAAIDVQRGKNYKRRFVVQVIGWGVDRENWLIDRYNITDSVRPVDPKNPEKGFHRINPMSYLEDWEILKEKVLNRSYRLADDSGRRMPIQIVACDIGGEGDSAKGQSVTYQAYEFWRKLKREEEGLHKKLMLVKGSSTYNGPKVKKTYPDVSGRKDRKSGAKGDVPVFMLNTLVLKDAIADAMGREESGPMCMHFPDWLGEWFYKELTAEKRTDKGWENTNKLPNEAVDLYTYNLGGTIQLMINSKGVEKKIDWSKPPSWALDWDENSEIIEANEEASTKKRKRRVYKRGVRHRVST